MFKRIFKLILSLIIFSIVLSGNVTSIAIENKIFTDNINLKDTFVNSKYYKKALKANENNDINKVIEFTNKLSKDYPKEAKLKYILGKLYYENKLYEKAIEQYDQAINIDQAYKEAYIAKVEYLISKQNYSEAISTLNKYMDLNGKDENLLYNLASLYGLSKEYDKAIDNFNKLIILNDKNYKAYKGLGFSNKKKNNIDNAIISFKNALSLHQDPEILDEIGLCYVQKKDFNTAIGYFSRANSINPSNSVYLYHAAIANIKADDFKEAYSVVKKLMAKFPEDPNAKELLLYLVDRIYNSEEQKKNSN